MTKRMTTYRVACPSCGYAYTITTDNPGIVPELEACPCGARADVTKEENR